MKLLRKLILSLTVALIAVSAMGQGVTTSSINGSVTDLEGNLLPGATVVAVHQPTGSQYGTITRDNGGFNLPNIQTGGPYTLTVSFVGYRNEVIEGIRLGLGEDRNFRIQLVSENISLDEVIVTAIADNTFNSGNNGTKVNIGSEMVDAMPTVSRSIDDLTRLIPQSSGTSFAGRDNRFNNYSIDGIIYNNNFGLGSDQFAGGNPLSLEAVEEVQVNLAPYDVRQGGFSGANVNAITKRGSNTFTGSAYGYYRNEKFTGNTIGDNELSVAEAFKKIIGGTVGGPIIKDKLFFFVSVEQEESSNPGLEKLAARPGLTPDGQTVSRVPATELEFVREQMMDLYDYETGDYEGYSFADQALRLNARIDYNINYKNKLMLRFNHYKAFEDVSVNGNSIRYAPSALRYRNTNRYGIEAMNFRNSHYSIDNNVTSLVAELNSIISEKMANNFRIGFNKVDDPIRSIPGGQDFPFIEILEFDGATPLYYMTLGNELYSVGNRLSNNIFNITNNFSYYTGGHSLTFGLNFEYMTFANAFNPVINSLYRYNSYDDFVASVIDQDPTVLPALFLQGYSYKGADDIPLDETAFSQVGFYVQDKFDVNNNLSVTAGLRVDMPFYPIDLPANPTLDALNLTFTNPITGEAVVPDVSVLPSVRPLISPRLGFNYDVQGDKTLQVRGGSGMFTGRIPFVWISNQVNNNGVTRGGFGRQPGDWEAGEWDGFQPEVGYYRPEPSELSATVSSNLAITDQDFKLPQVWRSNLGVDYKLPAGIVATVEGIFSKDLNSPLAVNINAAEPSTDINEPYNFPYWNNSDAYYDNPSFTDVIMLTNTNEGYYASITGELKKDLGEYGVAGLAYTRSVSKDFGLEGGSQAASLWPYTVVYDRNNPELGYSRFDQPNRVIGHFTLNTKALRSKLNTSISLFYDGGEPGRFSYSYSGSFNDGADRLMYIPESAADAFLVDKMDDDGVTVLSSASEQWTALDAYIEQDPYLSKHRGEVAERNGAKLSWRNRFDLSVAQDFMVKAGANQYKLQVHFDILNVGNLLNNEWGVSETYYQKNLMNFEGLDVNSNATFTLNTVSGTGDYPVETYRQVISLDETWFAQIGLKFLFN